jgi:hypothetical protein
LFYVGPLFLKLLKSFKKHIFFFILLPLDPDSESGSTKLIEYGSGFNSFVDPDPRSKKRGENV